MSVQKLSVFGLFVLGAGLLLTSCGGRAAKPVAKISPLDSKLSCSHLSGEYVNHDKRLVELVGERKERDRDALGRIAFVPLFIDLSDTQKNEALAIEERQDSLITLMADKNCVLPTPAQERLDRIAQKNADEASNE